MDDYDLSFSYYDEDEDIRNLQLEYESYDLHDSCVIPTIKGISYHFAALLLWNFIFRLTTQTVFIHINLCHCISIICGLAVIYNLLQISILYIMSFCILSYLIVHGTHYIHKSSHASFIASLGMLLLIICEFTVQTNTWRHVRSVYMILVMKIISLAYDIKIGRLSSQPNFIAYCGFLLCPANSIFGPWMTYKQYLSVFYKPIWNWMLLPQIILKGLTSIFYLLMSSCWVMYFIPSGSWKWFIAYRDALSFRTSNYFVSFLAETVMITAGYSQSHKMFTGSISNPFYIELPRSLIQIVIHWNIPMHTWLKTYVFREARIFGVFPAICLTYLISSLLHGLNFKLAAVLLSIGLFSYIEFKFRNKLSSIFNSCLNSYSCNGCDHLYKKQNIYVILGNLFFSIIAIVHLAYLGMVFEMNDVDDASFALDFSYTLNKWSSLDYTSHWIALVLYLLYMIV
ncbi:protein-serine O-palmitoleoyltransferase porcupine [Ctenocephalides felis]|uniref:protein-serine O-palmitoleoyltransferase porcupine n=1 Tax=Ctenocephalides felis TaxID=7515 RepID=UPI000E6E354D|nr:protein-serine O-palmitoleoyltransferase porcupine [Ctenocephalides felis]